MARSSPAASASIGSLGDGAEIAHADAQLGQPPDEVGVADRRGAHVDTAATLPEVERGAEQGDVRERLGRAHALTTSPQQRGELVGQRLRAREHARPQAAAGGRGTHDAARLAHEQVARCVIPFGQSVLVEGVEAPRRDPGQIEGGRARHGGCRARAAVRA